VEFGDLRGDGCLRLRRKQSFRRSDVIEGHTTKLERETPSIVVLRPNVGWSSLCLLTSQICGKACHPTQLDALRILIAKTSVSPFWIPAWG
jgi:hypothetical protein